MKESHLNKLPKLSVTEEPGLPVILLINGPNLNMLGKRSKEHYGSFTLADVEAAFSQKAEELGVKARFFQSNSEGEIVTAIHEAMCYADGIVINAGAYTHYSYAIFDALLLCGLPVMEVHISNIHEREAFRHLSVIQPACKGQICGLGLQSYLVGLEELVQQHLPVRTEVTAAPTSATKTLPQLRQEITALDQRLMELFQERLALAAEVAENKRHSGKSVYDQNREEEIVVAVRGQMEAELGSRAEAFIRTLMRISREKQYDLLLPEDRHFDLGKKLRHAPATLEKIKKVSYGGTLGSYSQQAAEGLFPEAQLQASTTFAEAWEAVVRGDVDAAVLPLENSTAGTVDDVYNLLQSADLYVVKAISLAISHKLAVLPGTKLEQIKKIVSHPQALSQCSALITEKKWQSIVAGNTAFAASQVQSEKDFSQGAIASEAAAKANGLEILPLQLCNESSNHTRFIAVTRDLIITPEADRISTILHLPHQSGALVAALQIFADRGLNLFSISSRPLPGKPWEYAFFLDFICPALGEEALLALYQLSLEMPYLKFLGWYAEQ